MNDEAVELLRECLPVIDRWHEHLHRLLRNGVGWPTEDAAMKISDLLGRINALLSQPKAAPKWINGQAFRCKTCGCLWRQHPDRTWSLYNSMQIAGKCCDNSADFLSLIEQVPASAAPDSGMPEEPQGPFINTEDWSKQWQLWGHAWKAYALSRYEKREEMPSKEEIEELRQRAKRGPNNYAAINQLCVYALREREGMVLVPREPTQEMIEAGISAIMGILRPKKTTRKMTIDELEKLINSENPPSLNIESDGSWVTELQPTQSSAREISPVVYKAMLPAAPSAGGEKKI